MSDLCRSLHVPSDIASSARVLCSAVDGAYQNQAQYKVQGGLAEEGEGVAWRSIAGTDLSLAVVRFIHQARAD